MISQERHVPTPAQLQPTQQYSRTYPYILGSAFGVLGLLSGWAPENRADWLLENVLVAALAVAMLLGHRRFRLQPWACGHLLAFLAIHELGAHFTYSRVPYDAWYEALSGQTLNDLLGWQRNNYDRLVHFCYGALLFHPCRLWLRHYTPLCGFWLASMAINLILSTSALYELIEWIGGDYFGGDESAAFVASQDDPWDAQKDMALALAGALMASLWRVTGGAARA